MDDPDLTAAALTLARVDNMDLEIDGYLAEIDAMAAELAERLPDKAEDLEKLKLLATYLFEENGFHGSRDDYYARSNSYFNEVLDDREGIPVTLTLLYLELAHRIGVTDVVGIGLPGHFVAQYKNGEIAQFIDVFERGKFMTVEEADRIVISQGFPGNAEDYAAASSAEIILRMLANLNTCSSSKRIGISRIKYAFSFIPR